MNEELQDIIKRLTEAKAERGRLTRIASESGISYRTIYAIMSGAQPSLGTVEKLTAYFKKIDKKLAKEGA